MMHFSPSCLGVLLLLLWCGLVKAEFGYCSDDLHKCDENCNPKWGVCVEVPKCNGEYVESYGCVLNVVLFVSIGIAIFLAFILLIGICCCCCSCCLFAKFLRRRKERRQEGTVLKPPPVDGQDGVTISLNQPGNSPLHQYTITTTTTTTDVKEPILQTTTVTMT